MRLTAHPTGTKFARRIKVKIEGSNVATVHCDGTVQFADHYEFSSKQLKQITFIAENFHVFYDNLTIVNDEEQ